MPRVLLKRAKSGHRVLEDIGHWGMALAERPHTILAQPRTALGRIRRLAFVLAALGTTQVLLALIELLFDGHSEWAAVARFLNLGMFLFPVMSLLAYLLWTTQDQLRAELRRADEGIAAMLGTVQDWTWGIDRDGRFVSSNDRIRDLLGYQAVEIIGQDSVDFLVGADTSDAVRQALVEYRETKQGWNGWELELRHKDGGLRFVEGYGVPILDSEGELIGWHGSVRDRTAFVTDTRELSQRTDEIRSVVEGGLLQMVFQPIVELGTGLVVGAEALTRIDTDPYRPPNVWFAAAREVGFGDEFELLAISLALAHLDELPPDVYLAINVSPSLLVHASLEGHLITHDLTRVVLELTEHASIDPDRYPQLLTAIRMFQAHGARIAIDDAGAGFSSLRHVLELEPNIIKLDISMTQSIDIDPSRKAMASCLAQFAAETRATVIAEGIETQAQMEAVVTGGIRHGQGFGLGKPMPLPLPARSLLDRVKQPASI